MEIILVLIPVSVVIVGIAVAAFFWAVDDGQFEDVERSGNETLFPDETSPPRNDVRNKPTVM